MTCANCKTNFINEDAPNLHKMAKTTGFNSRGSGRGTGFGRGSLREQPGTTGLAEAAGETNDSVLVDDFYDGLAGDGFERSPEARAEAKRADAASAKMGELMLAGWAMLAESCPNKGCPSMPLMRKRGAAQGLCVLCDPTFTKSESAGDKGSGVSAAAAPAAAAALSSSQSTSLLESETLLSPTRTSKILAAAPKPLSDTDWQKKRNAVSAKMGEKLLAGWAMLADACPHPSCRGTPLMRKKGAAAKVCVCCDDVVRGEPAAAESEERSGSRVGSSSKGDEGAADGSGQGTADAAADSAAGGFGSSGVDDWEKTPPSLPSFSMDSASQCLSAKLLRGWALHESTCASQPNSSHGGFVGCGSPLMSHAAGSKGRKVCVNAACALCVVEDNAENDAVPAPGVQLRTKKVERPRGGVGATASQALSEIRRAVKEAEAEEEDEEEMKAAKKSADDEEEDDDVYFNAPLYDTAEMSYRAKRFASSSSSSNKLSCVAGVAGGNVEAASLGAAKARALAAVAHKMNTTSDALVQSENDPKTDLHLTELLLKLAAAAAALCSV
eukprot:CAMPEP_0171989848 /NCGR_PEP_ID=MMETSP0993-20121228/276622_1 /TAXON_ID=483369 /ORGANISM="non described non described, Strain CCMP2098" /LENGTH=554 /DNA_ID=CAMNT_0012642845 /DNA_START=72 /DNA_END=1736 /DNA_ORIENTATION=-